MVARLIVGVRLLPGTLRRPRIVTRGNMSAIDRERLIIQAVGIGLLKYSLKNTLYVRNARGKEY